MCKVVYLSFDAILVERCNNRPMTDCEFLPANEAKAEITNDVKLFYTDYVLISDSNVNQCCLQLSNQLTLLSNNSQLQKEEITFP